MDMESPPHTQSDHVTTLPLAVGPRGIEQQLHTCLLHTSCKIPDIRRVALSLCGMQCVHELEPVSLQLHLSRGHGRLREVAERPADADNAQLPSLRQQLAAALPFEPSEDVLVRRGQRWHKRYRCRVLQCSSAAHSSLR